MSIDTIGTHQTHCCGRHGCKYGKDKKCPVVQKDVQQSYACEDCTSPEGLKKRIKDLKKELAWSESLVARGLVVSGYDEDFGY